MPEPILEFLSGARGAELLDSIATLPESELALPKTHQRLRDDGYSADEVAAAIAQAKLRRRALRKFGLKAQHMLFTEAGLEQATRALVAEQRAARFVELQPERVVDLGCGIGADAAAFASAGLPVLAVEIDAETADVARFNLKRLNLSVQCEVRLADASTVVDELRSTDAVYLDPARRAPGSRRSASIRRPDEYAPSLELARSLLASHDTAVKLGPGFDRDLIPPEVEAQWVSVGGEAVEMCLYANSLKREGVHRAALVWREDQWHEMVAQHDSEDAPVAQLGEVIYEPDAAIIRARLIGDLARSLEAHMVSESIAYLSASTLQRTPFAQAFRVRDVLPLQTSKLSRALRERNIGTLEIKKRGADIDPAQLRSQLKLSGTESATLIITRLPREQGEQRVAILADRVE